MSDKKTVLVVDDDPDVLAQITAILERMGLRVAQAQGREEAEEALLQVRPDLAILDLMMEEMDSGFVLSHHLRRLYPETPVIILTAVTSATGLDFRTRNPDGRSWIKADVLMDKPVRGEHLASEVRRLLSM